MEIIYLIFSLGITFSVIMCSLSINLIHSVFWLTFSFILSSLFLLAINLTTIAILVMIIYVGAIAILFVFSIMMVDVSKVSSNSLSLGLFPFILFSTLLLFLFSEFYSSNFTIINSFEPNSNHDFKELGEILYNNLGYLVIGSALVLLVPMIGALIFAKWFY